MISSMADFGFWVELSEVTAMKVASIAFSVSIAELLIAASLHLDTIGVSVEDADAQLVAQLKDSVHDALGGVQYLCSTVCEVLMLGSVMKGLEDSADLSISSLYA